MQPEEQVKLSEEIAALQSNIANAKMQLQELIKKRTTLTKEEKLALLREERKRINEVKYAISNELSVHKLRLAGNQVSISHIRYVAVDTVEQDSLMLPVPSYLRNYHEFTPNGGATHITITSPNGEQFLVSSYCHVIDNFDYKLGVKTALEGIDQATADRLLGKTK